MSTLIGASLFADARMTGAKPVPSGTAGTLGAVASPIGSGGRLAAVGGALIAGAIGPLLGQRRLSSVVRAAA